jgi:tetratricopeptide (TPR) repeat protein
VQPSAATPELQQSAAVPTGPAAEPAPPLASDEDLVQLATSGQWEELIGAASDRLSHAPEDQAALYWSGRAHLERGRQLQSGGRFARDLATSLLHRSAELLAGVRAEGERADAVEWALYARYLAGDDETIAADLERAAVEGSGYAARLRGQLARDRSEPSELEWFERAAKALPDRPDVRIDLARSRAGRGDRPGALAALEEARALGADRGSYLATLLAILPTADDANEFLARTSPLLAEPGAERDALLAWYRSWALQQLGRFEEAEAALAAAPDNLQPDIVRTHAQLLLRLQRPQDAIALVQPLAAQGDSAALDQLVSAGDSLAQAFRFQEALATYDEALAIEPAHPRALANRALTEARSGGPLDGYDALVAAHPDNAVILNDAALSRLSRGEREAARALLQRAVALPPDGAGVADARENLARVLLSDSPPDAAGALALLTTVLEKEPARDRSLVLRERARSALNASASGR